MKQLILVATLVTVISLSLQSAEPSAFGAGDLTNPNPYGLTSKERILLETKHKLHSVEVKSHSQENMVEMLSERIDGIESVLDSLGRKSHKNKNNIQTLDTKLIKQNANVELYIRQIEKKLANNKNLLENVSKDIIKNKEDINRITLAISELSKVLDDINAKYISKDEFNNLVKDFNNFKLLMVEEFKNLKNQAKVSQKSEFDNMSNGDVATKAKRFFEKKNYAKAIKYYRYLIKKNYRPANSHYVLGEVYFNQRDYGNAISYFKKSAKLYKKANYFPKLLATLMLHTAISMQRTKDYRNAKVFYRAVIMKYPNSNEAVEAKKLLEKLK